MTSTMGAYAKDALWLDHHCLHDAGGILLAMGWSAQHVKSQAATVNKVENGAI